MMAFSVALKHECFTTVFTGFHSFFATMFVEVHTWYPNRVLYFLPHTILLPHCSQVSNPCVDRKCSFSSFWLLPLNSQVLHLKFLSRLNFFRSWCFEINSIFPFGLLLSSLTINFSFSLDNRISDSEAVSLSELLVSRPESLSDSESWLCDSGLVLLSIVSTLSLFDESLVVELQEEDGAYSEEEMSTVSVLTSLFAGLFLCEFV